MDLSKILAGIDNNEILIQRINDEVGKEFVARSDFNAKNIELKSAQTQLEQVRASLEAVNAEKATWDKSRINFESRIKDFENATLKMRIAHETGIPYELASKLSGDDEDAIRKDAENFASFVKVQSAAPLKSTEPTEKNMDSALRGMLSNLRKE